MDQKPAPVSEQQPLVILTTPRLILRAAVEEDISILQDLIFGDSDVMRFAFSGAPMAGDAAEDFIRRFFTFGGSLTGFAVLTEKPAGEIIGFAGLASCGALGADDFEIAFSAWGRAWGGGTAAGSRQAHLVGDRPQVDGGAGAEGLRPRNPADGAAGGTRGRPGRAPISRPVGR